MRKQGRKQGIRKGIKKREGDWLGEGKKDGRRGKIERGSSRKEGGTEKQKRKKDIFVDGGGG